MVPAGSSAGLVAPVVTGQPQRRAGNLVVFELIDVPTWRSLDWADVWAPVWDLAQRAAVDAVVVYPGAARQLPTPPREMADIPIRELRIER